MRGSIRNRLTLAFISLAVGPLLVVGAILAWLSYTTQLQQALDLQHETTLRVSTEVTAFFQDVENTLNLASRLQGLEKLDQEKQTSVLSEMLTFQGAFDDLIFIDRTGQEQARASRISLTSAAQEDLAESDEFVIPQTTGKTYYSPVRFDEVSGEPLMTISVPIMDARTGATAGVLVSNVRIKKIWDLVAALQVNPGQSVYIVNAQGTVIAHRNPSVVLRGTTYHVPDQAGLWPGLTGSNSVLAVDKVRLGDQEFNVVAEQTATEALALAYNTILITAGLLLAALAISITLGIITVRQIVQPIQTMATTTQALSAGDLTQRVQVSQHDELGILGDAFNSMAAQLQELISGLEHRVEARTRDLKTAAQVSEDIATILDPDKLLPRVVELTKANFGLYHAQVYLLDPEGKKLNLVAGSGDAGRSMIHYGHNLLLDSQISLVARAARSQTPVVANNVKETPDFLPNPLLGETKSEAAFPLITGQTVIGVLDVQSDRVDSFEADQRAVFSTLAGQIAVVLRNAQLFRAAESARQEAERSNQIKSQFLASMSHELRTPLNAILAFSKYMRQGVFGPVNDEQVDYLGKTIDSGEHLLALINDVLDITKIQSHMLTLYVEEGFDISHEITNLTASAKKMLEDKPVELVLELDQGLPMLACDKRRVRQVFYNLISNAVKFTEEGKITISARKRDSELIFEVADTGPGIAPDEQEMIFQPFIQTETGIRHAGGTGLGLPISRELAAAHGGRLWVESEPGKGSKFFLQLPIKVEAPKEVKDVVV